MADVEKFTRYSTESETLQEAFTFVMDHVDTLGPHPSVEIAACYSSSDVNDFDHYHVSVYSAVQDKVEVKKDL